MQSLQDHARSQDRGGLQESQRHPQITSRTVAPYPSIRRQSHGESLSKPRGRLLSLTVER